MPCSREPRHPTDSPIACGVCYAETLRAWRKARAELKRERQENDALRADLEEANRSVTEAAEALGRAIG